MKHSALSKAIGPALLLAAAAIGASHLVQSTRAGADYGLLMISFIIIAGLIKYPSFRCGAHYSVATGHSLISAYKKQGLIAYIIFWIAMVPGLITNQAGVTLVAAGVVNGVFGLQNSLLLTAALLLLICMLIIIVGGFRLLDIIIKCLMLILALTTLIITIRVLGQLPWSTINLINTLPQLSKQDIIFIVALVGWMPAPLEATVWYSLWSLARIRLTHYTPKLKETFFDFNTGFIGTIILAICFVMLGAAVMFNRDLTFSASPVVFTQEFINLYTQTLGAWSRPIISIAAIAVMFSTILTVLDGNLRVIHEVITLSKNNDASLLHKKTKLTTQRIFAITLPITIFSLLLMSFFVDSLIKMIAFSATISFMIAPAIAWLNHRAVHHAHVADQLKPTSAFTWFSTLAIAALAMMAVVYIIMWWF